MWFIFFLCKGRAYAWGDCKSNVLGLPSNLYASPMLCANLSAFKLVRVLSIATYNHRATVASTLFVCRALALTPLFQLMTADKQPCLDRWAICRLMPTHYCNLLFFFCHYCDWRWFFSLDHVVRWCMLELVVGNCLLMVECWTVDQTTARRCLIAKVFLLAPQLLSLKTILCRWKSRVVVAQRLAWHCFGLEFVIACHCVGQTRRTTWQWWHWNRFCFFVLIKPRRSTVQWTLELFSRFGAVVWCANTAPWRVCRV